MNSFAFPRLGLRVRINDHVPVVQVDATHYQPKPNAPRNEDLGLLRHAGFAERQQIEYDVEMCLKDIYDTVDAMNVLARDPELTLNPIFHGDSRGKDD